MSDSDTIFDDRFEEISTLRWLPWVGGNYNSSPDGMRVLIIGESHYLPNKDEKWYSGVPDPDFTRGFIVDNAINNPDKKMKILRYFEKLLIGQNPSNDQKQKLWNSVVYMNFIQRPLGSSKDRPIDEDYKIGWSTFFEIFKILSPDIILFCGVRSSDFEGCFNDACQRNGFKYERDGSVNFNSKGINARKFIVQGFNGNLVLS